jgi:hypothetical protein
MPEPMPSTTEAVQDNASSLAPTPIRRMRAEHWLMVCGLVLAIAIFAGAVGMVVNLHDRSMTAHARELENTTQILADQTDRAFEAVRLMQAGLVERMRDLNVASAADYERAMSGYSNHLMLKDKVGAWPHIGSLTLNNSEGKLFNFSRFWPLPNIDVTDRDFFRAVKSDPTLTFFMSERPGPGPFISRARFPARTASFSGWCRAQWRWITSTNISAVFASKAAAASRFSAMTECCLRAFPRSTRRGPAHAPRTPQDQEL